MEKQSKCADVYICIDLKCFYASVECIARGLDPFETNLVVADPERSRTTICLAITPALKRIGVKNRCRVFEIPDEVPYIMAKPRMRRYMEVSAQIYAVYLRYVSPDDIHVYSIDECFIYATPYLRLYSLGAKEFARMLMDEVRAATGICATAGIGTNLFLAKVALDITAKHVPDNIGVLDERSFIETLWTHRPITDIWNIGPGIARRLAQHGVHDLKGPRLGAGAVHHSGHQKLCAQRALHRQRAGAPLRLFGRRRPPRHARDDRRKRARPCKTRLIDRSHLPFRGLRQ